MADSNWNNSSSPYSQQILFESISPSDEWVKQTAKHALDELFNATLAYRSSRAYLELLEFVRRFRFYSPYNALLIHMQRPGARFVAPPTRWRKIYGRHVNPNANPIVILQPMGPVMFVFDVADTEPGPNAKPLPVEVEKPFEVRRGRIRHELKRTIENAKRDGIRVQEQKAGSQRAGSIQRVNSLGGAVLLFEVKKGKRGKPIYKRVPVHYELIVNQDLSREARFASLVHELGHLYSGHLGTPDPKWWPDRRGLSRQAEEFEAESIAYLVCGRFGIESPSEAYLSNYVEGQEKVPSISLECVMKAASLIENMACKRLKLREGEK